MLENKINSITPKLPKDRKKNKQVSKFKRKVLKNYKLVRVLIILVAIFFCVISFFAIRTAVFGFSKSLVFNTVKNFVFTPDSAIDQRDGRVNILVLGKGGAGHDSPDLTDTMLIASVPTSQKKIVLVSLPRDIWIPALSDKINSAYYWGNQKTPGGGIPLAKSTVEEVVGAPMNYVVIFDFQSFRQIIDLIGGIDVDVPNSFVDTMYPIPGRENAKCPGDPLFKCRYRTIKFEKGLTHMDGDTALAFVRSRHASGIEGNDIARENRQQIVLLTLKNKFMDKKVYSDPGVIVGLFNIVKTYVETDITIPQMAYLARKILVSGKFVNFLIPSEFLITPSPAKYFGAFVFIPKAGDWSQVQQWFLKTLNEN